MQTKELKRRLLETTVAKVKKSTIQIGEREVCDRCYLDIEWNGNAWWDRGANTSCPADHRKKHKPYIEKSEVARQNNAGVN